MLLIPFSPCINSQAAFKSLLPKKSIYRSNVYIEQVIPLTQLEEKIRYLNLHVQEKRNKSLDFISAYQQKKLIEKLEIVNIDDEINAAISQIKQEKEIEDGMEGLIKMEGSEKIEQDIEINLKQISNKLNLNKFYIKNEDEKIAGPNIYEQNIFNSDLVGHLHTIMPDLSNFSNTFVADSFIFLSRNNNSIEFLQNQFCNHIKETTKCDVIDIPYFTNIKYNNDTYDVENYHGRFLYAEIYVYFRIGDFLSIINILNEFSAYFNQFKDAMFNFLDNKTQLHFENDEKDFFKSILYKIMKNDKDGHSIIINTFEDWVWYQIVTQNDFKNKLSEIKSDSVKLFGYLLGYNWEYAIDILLKGDFNAYECYYILREINKRFKNQLESESVNKICINDVSSNIYKQKSYNDNRNKKNGNNELIKKDTNNDSKFLHLVFMIVSKFKSIINKTYLIVSIKNLISTDVYNYLLPKLIVKHECYDILRVTKFDNKINNVLCDILVKKNDRKKLLSFYFLFDNIAVERLLIEEMKELCLYATNIDEIDYLNEIVNNINSLKANAIYKLLIFIIKKDEVSLRRSIFCNESFFDSDVKKICERIVFDACRVAKVVNDEELGGKIFTFLGKLDLTKEQLNMVNKELLGFI
ncbi:hypothetical protein COBT_000482 [Conglomerata obtusa]